MQRTSNRIRVREGSNEHLAAKEHLICYRFYFSSALNCTIHCFTDLGAKGLMGRYRHTLRKLEARK